jgi:hypothetical protein
MAKTKLVTSQGFEIHEDQSGTAQDDHTFLDTVIIDQGAADDAALKLQSSDVAHGVTGETDTDTYGLFKKASATSGGMQVDGFADTGALGLLIRGIMKTADVGKATTAIGAVAIHARLASGVGLVSAGSNANMLTIGDGTTTRFVFDAEGSFFADVESTTFDKYDDLALLNAMDMETQRRQGDPVRAEFGDFLKENKSILEKEKIVHYPEEGSRAMVNLTKLMMLHTGAIRQVGRMLSSLAEQNAQLTQKLNLIESK